MGSEFTMSRATIKTVSGVPSLLRLKWNENQAELVCAYCGRSIHNMWLEMDMVVHDLFTEDNYCEPTPVEKVKSRSYELVDWEYKKVILNCACGCSKEMTVMWEDDIPLLVFKPIGNTEFFEMEK